MKSLLIPHKHKLKLKLRHSERQKDRKTERQKDRKTQTPILGKTASFYRFQNIERQRERE
jgi:hypothetical protein